MNAIDDLVRDVRDLMSKDKGDATAAPASEVLSKFLRIPDLLDQLGLSAGFGAKRIWEDAEQGFIIQMHEITPGRKSPPHDHGPHWVLYGVHSGELTVSRYHWQEGPNEQSMAHVDVLADRVLRPGDVEQYVSWDVHSTANSTDGVTTIGRLLSCNVDAVERHRFDRAANSYVTGCWPG